ncbi:MAG: OPT/YSL family transporter, partial [Bacteroidota bacterium]
ILMQVKSPMLVSVGMYLPIETTFAIFVGGIFKGTVDWFTEKRKYNLAQKTRVENTGVLLASGMIAGEALMGLVVAILAVVNIFIYDYFVFFQHPSFLISLVIIGIIGFVMIQIPLKNAGKPDQPAPPSAGM